MDRQPVTGHAFFGVLPMSAEPNDVMALLEPIRQGSTEAKNQLVRLLYDRTAEIAEALAQLPEAERAPWQ